MAEKGWTAQAATAAGVAAAMGAAQLGLGYGLAVVVWPTSATAGDTVWLSSLGWATWIAAGSTVFGAIAGSRLGAAGQPHAGVLRRLTLAVAAAVGALLTVVLIAVPARAAERADTFSPQTTAAGYAVAGILIGIAVAYWAVASRPVAANLIMTAVWLWALAVAAIAYSLARGVAMTGIHLSGWRPRPTGADFRFGAVQWPEALLMLGAALLIGAIAVWPAVRRGDHGLGAATSGAVGPLLLALTFLILVPRVTTALGELESPYLTAPYAVLAGLAGSALVVALAGQAAERRAGRAPARGAPPADAATPAAVPAPVAVPAKRAVPAARGRSVAPVTATIGAPVAVPPEEPATGDRAGGLFGRLKPGRRRSEAAGVEPATETAIGTGTATGAGSSTGTPTGTGTARGTATGTAQAVTPAPRPAPAAVPATGAPRASTVAPPPETPTVARINPGDAPAGGAGRPAAQAAGRTEPSAPPVRKPARPRRGAAGPDGDGDTA